MPQLTAKKYQLTFTAGVTMKTSDIDFKFFHINKWDNGEFKGDAISTTSDLVEITESGNLKLQEGQKFERGGVYKFTVDVTKGNTKAVLTVEKVGQVDLPRPDITINGMKLEEGSSDMYQLQMSLTQNQTLEIGGIEDLNDWYVDPDYLVKTGDNHLKFLPVAGSYRVMVNATRKYFAVVRMNGNSEAGLDADGHGAVWLLGYGMGSPSIKDEFNWDFSTAYCVAEISPKFISLLGRLVLKAVRLSVNAYDTIISVLNIWVESLGISNFIKRTCKWIRLPGTYSMLMRKILYWPLRWNRELLMCLR